MLFLEERGAEDDAAFIVNERSSRRVEEDEALLLDERRREGLQQGLQVGETLNPACVRKLWRLIRLAVGRGIELQLLREPKPALLQHPAIRDRQRAPGWQMNGPGQDMPVVLAPSRLSHHALEGVRMLAQKSRARPNARRRLRVSQGLESLPVNGVLDGIASVLRNELERKACAVCRGSIADVPIPAPVVPRYAN